MGEKRASPYGPALVTSAIYFLVHRIRIQLVADACLVKSACRIGTDPLMAKRREVQVIGVLAGDRGQAKQLRPMRTGLPVVFGQVGMKVHALLIPYG